jgi:bifunctional ADP-heptose synthase (sugar kinase/adenylyltransferase)
VLALNTDASVRRLVKGEDRPINALADRAAVAAALESVSLVTWFDDDTPLALVLRCAPDVLAKGGDWPVERIVAAIGCARPRRAGRVDPFEHERSTTAMLARIRNA